MDDSLAGSGEGGGRGERLGGGGYGGGLGEGDGGGLCGGGDEGGEGEGLTGGGGMVIKRGWKGAASLRHHGVFDRLQSCK